MAPFVQLFVSTFCFLLLSSTFAQYRYRPSAVVIPVTKDNNTLQYVTTITQRTLPVPVKLVVDLGGQFVWMDCESNYNSTSYHPASCNSTECSLANAHPGCSNCNNVTGPGCNHNTCDVSPQNGVTESITGGAVSMDVLYFRTTDGYNLGETHTVPQFIFACARNFLLEGLANDTQGIAALGRTEIALPSQLARVITYNRKFGLCLSSSATPGAIFFGDGPYEFSPGLNVTDSLVYTPMLQNNVSTNGVALRGEPSFEYFIGVTGITIGGNNLAINSTLLSIAQNGVGGTKLSTVAPYSVLESSIYTVFTDSFIREAAAMNITRVASVAPFTACFSSQSISSIRGRLQVPGINLVLPGNNVVWPIYPTNSMVRVTDDVLCLGFVDANTVEDVDNLPRASILLGGYQLENNFIQFDQTNSTVGFTNMLYTFTTTCESFNSTLAAV